MIDLRDLALWWWPIRIWLLLPAALAGFIYGLHVEKAFVPEYTAEAVVQVKSWAAHLDRLAARMGAPVLVPQPADPELRRLNVDDATRQGAIDKLAGNIEALRNAPQPDLTAYVAELRAYGAAEISLLPPAGPMFAVIEPPHIAKASEPRLWRWYWAAAATVAALLLGSFVYLVMNEADVAVSHETR